MVKISTFLVFSSLFALELFSWLPASLQPIIFNDLVMTNKTQEVEVHTQREDRESFVIDEVIDDTYIQLSEKDLIALERIVEAEATGEDIMGRIMVANVVFNRVNSANFPNTVYDVIHQRINGRAQFSPIDDNRYYTVTVSDKTREAVDRALAGETYAEDALFFMARSMASEAGITWFDRNLTKIKKHGAHEFFTY
ncbi:spore germination cell wall hydrolase CwlJ-like protein [Desulfitispora alkaliphila]|uniref:cell wall hydrolase n=1 Tax=Desulfitispora alkaliphila TaxID=622674 RepID=UPI003D1DC667